MNKLTNQAKFLIKELKAILPLIEEKDRDSELCKLMDELLRVLQ